MPCILLFPFQFPTPFIPPCLFKPHLLILPLVSFTPLPTLLLPPSSFLLPTLPKNPQPIHNTHDKRPLLRNFHAPYSL